MRWFYSLEGDCSKRGLVEQDVLFALAKKGELKPSDLVWKEDSEEGWILASSVEGLFSGKAQQPAPPASPKPRQARKASTPSAKPAAAASAPSKPLKKVVTTLMVLALLMVCAVVATMVMKGKNDVPDVPVPTGPSPETIRSNRVVELSQQIDTCLEKEDLGTARNLWREMKENDDYGLITESYRKRINTLQIGLAHFLEMQNVLRSGNLNDKTIAELIKVYEKRGGNAALTKLADSVLADRASLTPAKAVALARLFKTLGDTDRVKKALAAFSSIAPTSGPPVLHMEVVKMYTANDMQAEAMRLLEGYLTHEKENSTAWYELGAMRCVNGKEDEAMDALKQAVEYGGNEIRRKAVDDPRFKAISDKWSFGRLTKIRD